MQPEPETTPRRVAQILARSAAGFTHAEIAREFAIRPGTVANVINRGRSCHWQECGECGAKFSTVPHPRSPVTFVVCADCAATRWHKDRDQYRGELH